MNLGALKWGIYCGSSLILSFKFLTMIVLKLKTISEFAKKKSKKYSKPMKKLGEWCKSKIPDISKFSN